MPNQDKKLSKQQVQLRQVLLTSFEKLKNEHPTYSLRSFARKLGVSPAAISEMMHGKRLITRKTIVKILDHIELTDEEKGNLIRLEKTNSEFDYELKEYTEVDISKHPMVSEWQYFAILSLSTTADFKSDPKWIAERLNISVAVTKKTIENLVRLELLLRNSNGDLSYGGAKLKIESALQRTIFKKGHLENLELARKALLKTNQSALNFSSMTMTIDRELLDEAKEIIQNFRRQLAHFMESGKKEEVYKLNIQLFPVSRR